MKNCKYLYLWAVACFAISACEDDDIVPTRPTVTPAADGSEIIFGARAGFENNGDGTTRTEYADLHYTYNGKKYQRIDWVFDDDKIEIFSPNTANTSNSHYIVRNAGIEAEDTASTVVDHQNDFAYLERIGDSSLQWNGDDTHTFYAMYPSSMMFVDDPEKTLETGVYMDSENAVVNGIIPTSQQPITVEKTTNGYVAKPNMDYAYMVAKSTASREDGQVGLTFMPLVTAVEIELTMPDESTDFPDITIGEIQVASTKPIAGSFAADISGWDGKSATDISCQYAETNTANDFIQITTRIEKDGTYIPVPLADGQSLTFTVFLLPGTDVSDLTIRLSDVGAGYTSKTLKLAEGKTLAPANIKTRITGLRLPTPFEVDANKWMAQLNDTVSLARLSLPGTGNSFSYLAQDNTSTTYPTDPDYYKAQLEDFDTQWRLGIRAFEVVCPHNTTDDNDLGNVSVRCNNEIVYQADGTALTVREVCDMIMEKLNTHEDEAAMLIITYQPTGSISTSEARNPATFMTGLNQLYSELVTTYGTNKFVTFSPELKLIDRDESGNMVEATSARGKLMIVARPTQFDEDNATVRSAALAAVGTNNYLVVDGCGAGKDKWGKRGYRINGSLAADIKDAVTSGTSQILENYMYYNQWYNPLQPDYPDASSTSISWPTWDGVVTKDEYGDYKYAAKGSGDDFTVWFQEWARVVDEDFKVMFMENGFLYTFANYFWWRESYTQKYNDVVHAFDLAISNTGEYKNYVFINSLCGYMLDKQNRTSYSPYMNVSNGTDWEFSVGGQSGLIGDLASELNTDFYNHVLQSGMNEKTGPTGIILMDRVSASTTAGGSHYLPGTIIANNFKFGKGLGSDGGDGGDDNKEPDENETPGGGDQGGVEG